MPEPRHLAWVEVDLDAIARNFQQLQQVVGASSSVMPVVKSNAYGHGLLPVARTVVAEGARYLGVALLEEAFALRDDGIEVPIIVLGPTLPAQAGEAARRDITLAVFDLDTARALDEAARQAGRPLKVHAKIDTGLGRLSVTPPHALDFIVDLKKLQQINIDGIYTHLADAEGIDQSITLRQYVNFKKVLADVEAAGISIPLRHVAGSAAAMLMPELRYDLVRAGISLYGLWPSEETRLLMIARGQNLLNLLHDEEVQARGVHRMLSTFLRPALQFKTTVAQVKSVPTGWSIGYGCTFETRRDTRVAILPVGYADGYDRHLSNSGQVLIRGHRAPVIGRVCMNLTMVDVTDIAEVQQYDEVVLIGTQHDAEITAEEMAEKTGTINYEIVTRIRWDLPRVYAGGALSARRDSSTAQSRV